MTLLEKEQDLAGSAKELINETVEATMPTLAKAASLAAEKSDDVSDYAAEKAERFVQQFQRKRSWRSRALVVLGLAALVTALGVIAAKLTARGDRPRGSHEPDPDAPAHAGPPEASTQPDESET